MYSDLDMNLLSLVSFVLSVYMPLSVTIAP